MTRRIGSVVVVLSAVALGCALSSCTSSHTRPAGSETDTARVNVVAATDVWGDVAAQIAGDHAAITSIVTSPTADPHSYEANARNQLAVTRADIVIENGGGYDDFLSSMVAAHGKHAQVINAVEISGKKPDASGSLNEHVWYDFPTVVAVANMLRDRLIALDQNDAASFRSNAAAFIAKVRAMQDTESHIAADHHGEAAAITEPVPLYMLTACGLVNRTPSQFSEAVEDGHDVAPRVLQLTLNLFNNREVRLLAYNSQTVDATTERVLAAAKANNIPVVPVTETLPADQSYLTWMDSNLKAISSALGSR
jgi:zinc/manganese transport system substrate-binding protein